MATCRPGNFGNLPRVAFDRDRLDVVRTTSETGEMNALALVGIVFLVLTGINAASLALSLIKDYHNDAGEVIFLFASMLAFEAVGIMLLVKHL